jgi:hypothetical protein
MYDGQDVMFKFHFGSDSSVVYPGWDIDDVYVGEPEDRGRPIALTMEKIVNQSRRNSDAETRLDRMDGYSLYRGFATDEDNFEDWDLIVSTLQDTTYEDTTWQLIEEPGVYEYCVRVEYTGGVLSEPSFSNQIGFDMYVPVTINVTANSGDQMNGAEVVLACQDGIHTYTGAVANGTVNWEEVWKGVYDLSVTMDGYAPHEATDIWITDTVTLNVVLIENILPPSNLTVNPETGIATWEVPSGGGAVIESILLVDDDGSAYAPSFTDTQPIYTAILDASGIDYDIYDITVSGTDGPEAAYMSDYDLVIWECGEQWQLSNSLSATDETELGTYLDNGGFLVLSAHDYLWDRYPNASTFTAGQFPNAYLGVAGATQDAFTVGGTGPATVEINGAGYTDGLTVILQDIFSEDAMRDGVYLDYLTPNANGASYSTYAGNNIGIQTANTIFTTAGWAGLLDGDDTVLDYVLDSISNFPSATRHLDYYNVYLDDVLKGQVTQTQYQYTEVETGNTYTAGVSAHYSSGFESEIVTVDFTFTGVGTNPNVIPEVTVLNGNYPNPFNPTTDIVYGVAEDANVTIEIYNVRGQKVKTLVDEYQDAGSYRVNWNGTNDNNQQLSSGIYFYKMDSGRYTSTKKMILMK